MHGASIQLTAWGILKLGVVLPVELCPEGFLRGHPTDQAIYKTPLSEEKAAVHPLPIPTFESMAQALALETPVHFPSLPEVEQGPWNIRGQGCLSISSNEAIPLWVNN